MQHKFVCPWRLADREILFSQETSLLRVPTDGQPEIGRMVGKGLRVAHHQLVVSHRGDLTPVVCFVQLAHFLEDPRELRRILRVVRAVCQLPEKGNSPLISP